MVTDEHLHAIMPAVPVAKRSAMLPFLQAAMTEFEIDRPAREAAFIAQLAHESGQFRFMEEIWGPTTAQKRYEPLTDLATRLGNTETGDGKRFKGRGPIQVTGRANYKRFGDLLGVDLIGEPTQAAQPELGFRIAALFWSKKGLNALADLAGDNAFREITRRINGGFNGLEDRRRLYQAACKALGVTSPAPRPGTPGFAPAFPDEPVFDRGFEVIGAVPGRQASRPRRRKRAASTAKKTARRKTAKPPRRASAARKGGRRPKAGAKRAIRATPRARR